MSLPSNYIPRLPFSGFKWKWASLQCTEGINDPVVLMGVLSCMHKCQGEKFSSPEFAASLEQLQHDVNGSGCTVNLGTRSGDRNLMRNSGQYWKALGLIPNQGHDGRITLTDFGRSVAERRISQTDFAAATILSLTLPNPNIQSSEECDKWHAAGISLHPLSLLLRCLLELLDSEGEAQAYISVKELYKIVIPLSGSPDAIPNDYAKFILLFRNNELNEVDTWPNVVPDANDKRIAREFLLFLKYYGYITLEEGTTSREDEKYHLNSTIVDEIRVLVSDKSLLSTSLLNIANSLKESSITHDLERKRITTFHSTSSQFRPNQAAFRKALMDAHPKCIVTNVSMPEVLEAAHIKPFAYQGDDTASNGFLLRSDIHILFDSGDLRISPLGDVNLSERARNSYGESTIRDFVRIPDYVDKANLEWRWNYYHGY